VILAWLALAVVCVAFFKGKRRMGDDMLVSAILLMPYLAVFHYAHYRSAFVKRSRSIQLSFGILLVLQGAGG
jgi:hypothetical protein